MGFRCPKCSGGGAQNSVGQATASGLVVARILLICTGLGYGFGVVEPMLNLPFIGVFVCLAAGLLVGKISAPIVDDRRVAKGLLTTIIFGLLIGMSLTDLAFALLTISQQLGIALTSEPAHIVPMAGALVGLLFNPVAFIMGFLRTSIWKM